MIQTIIPEGVGEPQIRRAFMALNQGLMKLSNWEMWREIDDHSGVALTAGTKAEIYVPYDCVLTQWTELADQVGSVKIDLWVLPYASYPPTNANSICGANEPLINNAQSAQDTTLSGWSPRLSAGDCIIANVDSATTIERVMLHLVAERS